MTKLACGLLALLLVGCGQPELNPADVLTRCDYEAVAGWSCEATNPSLTQEQAHSGRYAAKVAPGIDYGLGYHDALGHLVPARVARLRLHAWVYLPADHADAVLVTELSNPGQPKPLVWDGAMLEELGRRAGFARWIEVERTIAVPAETNVNSQLRVYLWRNTSQQPVYLDDLTISKAD